MLQTRSLHFGRDDNGVKKWTWVRTGFQPEFILSLTGSGNDYRDKRILDIPTSGQAEILCWRRLIPPNIAKPWYTIAMQTASKKKIVHQAIANERLEGLHVSQESQSIAQKYVAGKISAKTAAEKIRANYSALA